MNDDERGKIRRDEFASILRDFSGLRYGKITPTDIDFFIDFGNRIFIIGELKYGDVQLPIGQRLALERLSDACSEVIEVVYVLVARHECQPGEKIDTGKCVVTEYRNCGKWIKPKIELTVREAIDRIVES